MARIGDYDALIIRSATKVTADVIDAGTKLQGGRAAPAWASTTSTWPPPPSAASSWSTRRRATCSPRPSTPSPCIMACARNIPQAHAALKDGRWEQLQVRRRRARRQDARHRRPRPHRLSRRRAAPRGLDMQRASPTTRSCRPSASTSSASSGPRRSRRIYREADFITVHLPKNAETHRLRLRRRLRRR